jgi:hypothetical protein
LNLRTARYYVRGMNKLGPYSRERTLAKIDGRTREGKLLAAIRADLAAHVGGAPSATQRVLISRAASLSLQLAMMERNAAEKGGTMSERDGRQYLAWNNSLTRLMRQIGIKATTPAAPVLSDHLAGIAARRGQQAAA